MRVVGDKETGTIRPDFDSSISIDFQGARITSDTGFLLMREIDQRFNILGAAVSKIEDPRSARHTDHSLLQLLRQRVYQVGQAMRIAMTASRSVKIRHSGWLWVRSMKTGQANLHSLALRTAFSQHPGV